MEDILATQRQLIEAINGLHSNFKKDGAERKTSDYLRRRLATLEQYYTEFHNNHMTLLSFGDKSHTYFSTNQYDQITEKYKLIKSTIESYTPLANRPQTPVLKPPTFEPTKSQTSNINVASTSTPTATKISLHDGNEIESRFKKQATNFKAFLRTTSNIDLDLVSEKWEFEDILKTLQSRWEAIDSLHWELDNEYGGSNPEYEEQFTHYEKYFQQIKKDINKKIKPIFSKSPNKYPNKNPKTNYSTNQVSQSSKSKRKTSYRKQCIICNSNDHLNITLFLHDAFAPHRSGSNAATIAKTPSHQLQQDNDKVAALRKEPSEILLATAIIEVQAVDGSYQKMRVLLDQGSQTSIIREAQLRNKENNCKGKITIKCSSLVNDFTFETELTNNSVYFDKITNMHLIRDNWHLIVYYDTNPYQEGIAALLKYIQYLETVCPAIRTQTPCDGIMLQLAHEFEEIKHYNNIIMINDSFMTNKRRRRGLIDGVGYVANSLFGVLDQRFAEKYEKDIDLLKNNENHLYNLWKNQTSVVEAEFNDLYSLLKVRAKYSGKYLIIEIKIPLIERDLYEVFHLIPVPRITENNMMMKVETISQMAAINMRKDSYLTITDTDLQSCLLQNPATILCHIRRPIHHMKDDHSLCETIPGTRTCKTKSTPCKNDWIDLSPENKYYYLCCDDCNVKLLCESQVRAIRLSQAGLLRVGDGCLVKTEDFMVYSSTRLSSKISTKTKIISPEIAPINHLINITMPEFTYEANPNNSDNIDQFEAIKKSIEIMKQSAPLSTNISYHDVHQYTAIYLIVFGILVLAAAYCFTLWRRQHKGHRSTPAAQRSTASATLASSSPNPVTESVVIECSEIRANGQCSNKSVKSGSKNITLSTGSVESDERLEYRSTA
ncbi:hypothetical protein SFRURICE_020980 [Spodoptera frugiperda]|nr:hypothetical protein SFRURICE_020980 [Spodoptera frugiperda]